MSCWRVFIFSLRLTLLLATLALGFSAAYATCIDTKANNSIPAAFYEGSLGVPTIGGVNDLYTTISPVSVVPHFEQTQVNHNDIHNPVVFLGYWQQFGISLPPFERQSVTVFSSSSQLEPLFVFAYEFLPEIRARKHFLTLVPPANNLPWYLRSTPSNKHNRVTGWKDGNNLYTGSITYLS